jgi:phage baseplate assembly protein W
MATYTGFSTIGAKSRSNRYEGGGTIVNIQRASNSFKMTDQDLVTRDLLNAFNIKQGEKPGNPKYGTIIQGFMFEPNLESVRSEMEHEVRRVIASDPRITLISLSITPQDNQVLIALQMQYAPFEDTTSVTLGINKLSGAVSQVA